MDKLLPIIFAAVYFLEGIFSGSIGLAIMKVRPAAKKILLYGALFAATAFLVRDIFVIKGWHSLFMIALNSFYIAAIFRITYKKAVSASVLAFIIVVAAEITFFPLVIIVSGMSIEEITGDKLVLLQAAIPHLLLLGGIALALYRARGFHKEESPAAPEA